MTFAHSAAPWLCLASLGALSACGAPWSGYREVSFTPLNSGAAIELANSLGQRRSVIVGSGGFTVHGGSLRKARLYREMRVLQYSACHDGFGQLSIDRAGDVEVLGRIRPSTWAAIEPIVQSYSVRTANRCETSVARGVEQAP